MTLEDTLTAYLAERQPSPAMISAVRHGWRRFSEWCETQNLHQLRDLTPAHIAAFHQRLLWEPGASGRLYSANSVSYILCQVRNLARWAKKRGHIPHDPTRDLVLPRPLQPQGRVLGWNELQAILDAVDLSHRVGLRDAALYRMLAETSLQTKRCLELDLRDVPALTLEPKTLDYLQAYLDQARPLWVRNPGQRALFLTIHGARLGSITVGQRLDQLALIAGIEGSVTPRMLWRSYRAALTKAGDTRFSFNRDP